MANDTSVYSKVYLSALEQVDAMQEFQGFEISSRQFAIYLLTDISSFIWKNLPDKTMPQFMIERFLIRCGRVGFFKDDKGEFRMFPAFAAGELLPNSEYSKYTLIAPDGTSFTRNAEDVEIIFNNSLKLPDMFMLKDFAEKSSFALEAVQTALERAMLPPVFTYDDPAQDKIIQELQTKGKLLKAAVTIPKTGKYGSTPIERLPFYDNRETDVLSMWDIYSRNDRLFYRNFGVSTVGIQKNERLTRAESTGEEEMTRYSMFYDKYKNRKDACERIKAHFGYDLDFEVARDQKSVAELELSNEEKVELEKIEATKGSNIAGEGGNENVAEKNNDESTD